VRKNREYLMHLSQRSCKKMKREQSEKSQPLKVEVAFRKPKPFM
jgi:hypothetical protein